MLSEEQREPWGQGWRVNWLSIRAPAVAGHVATFAWVAVVAFVGFIAYHFFTPGGSGYAWITTVLNSVTQFQP